MDNHFYDDDDDDIGGGNEKLRAKRVKQGPDLVEIETLESQAFYLDQSSTPPSTTWYLLKLPLF